MVQQLRAFLRDGAGATAIEYALIAGLIALALIFVLQQVGTELGATFVMVETGLKSK